MNYPAFIARQPAFPRYDKDNVVEYSYINTTVILCMLSVLDPQESKLWRLYFKIILFPYNSAYVTIRVIRAGRKWGKGKRRGAQRLLVGKRQGKRISLTELGPDWRILQKYSLKNRRNDTGWIELAQVWDRWEAVMNVVMNLRVHWISGNFFVYLRNSFLKKKVLGSKELMFYAVLLSAIKTSLITSLPNSSPHSVICFLI